MFILLNWCQVSAICYCVICYCLFALMERECVWTLRDIANKALFSESEDNIESFGNFSITLSLKVVTHNCPYMRVSACSSSVLFLSCILSDGPTLLDCTRRVIYCKWFNSFSANVTKTIVLWRPGTTQGLFRVSVVKRFSHASLRGNGLRYMLCLLDKINSDGPIRFLLHRK